MSEFPAISRPEQFFSHLFRRPSPPRPNPTAPNNTNTAPNKITKKNQKKTRSCQFQCATASVALAAWLFVLAQFPQLPLETPRPRIVCDSDTLFQQAALRPDAAAGFQRSTQTVLLPTNSYEDETLGPLLAHEFTHYAQAQLLSQLNDHAMEVQAYAMQATFATRMAQEGGIEVVERKIGAGLWQMPHRANDPPKPRHVVLKKSSRRHRLKPHGNAWNNLTSNGQTLIDQTKLRPLSLIFQCRTPTAAPATPMLHEACAARLLEKQPLEDYLSASACRPNFLTLARNLML